MAQVIFSCGENNTVIKSIDNGLTWTDLTTTYQDDFIPPNTIGNDRFTGIFSFDGNTVYVCTWSGYILKSTDGGVSLELCYDYVSNPPSGFDWRSLNKIKFINESVGYAVGYAKDGTKKHPFVVKTTDGGVVWTEYIIEEVEEYEEKELFDIQLITDQDVFIVGEQSQLWITNDGGNNWTDKSDDIKATTFGTSPIEFFDIMGDGSDRFNITDNVVDGDNFSNSGIVVSKQTIEGGTRYGIEITTGTFEETENVTRASSEEPTSPITNWHDGVRPEGCIVKSIHFPNGMTGYISGVNYQTDSGNYIPFWAKTTDGGNIWEAQWDADFSAISEERATINSIYFITKDIGHFVFGYNVIYKTEDGGVSLDGKVDVEYKLNRTVMLTEKATVSVGKDFVSNVITSNEDGEYFTIPI